MPSTTSKSGRAAVAVSAAVRRRRADDRYVTLDGQRVTVQRRGATRMKVTAGPHTIAAAMIPRTRVTGADSVYNAPTRSPGISQVVISGPFNASGPGDTPSRRRLFVCTPQPTDACAKTDPRHARVARLPSARSAGRARHGHAPAVLSRGPRARLVRHGHPAGGRAGARRSAVPLPLRTTSRRPSRRARRSASATTSWPRGCRSSSGAAFRTTS